MMSGFFSLIATLFWFVFLAAIVLAVIAFFGYNKLRSLTETVREAMSNIGVTSKKQVSLVNQLIEVVKGYQESEKLVMLKVSEDVSSVAQAAMVYQQSSVVLSAANGLAQKFPELKADQQYTRLIDSIQACESQLEKSRQSYNAAVKAYNVRRTSIPAVFYASALGFKSAPYLEFIDGEQSNQIDAMKAFSSDDDGERLNRLLGQAGSGVVRLSSKALEGGRTLAAIAQEKTRQISHGPATIGDNPRQHDGGSLADAEASEPFSNVPPTTSSVTQKFCQKCSKATSSGDVFCPSCGHAQHATSESAPPAALSS
jgi:LemA protein